MGKLRPSRIIAWASVCALAGAAACGSPQQRGTPVPMKSEAPPSSAPVASESRSADNAPLRTVERGRNTLGRSSERDELNAGTFDGQANNEPPGQAKREPKEHRLQRA